MDVESLERVLRSYGMSADRGTLKGAFEDPEHGTAFAEWATVHLGPDNLLSKDELSLYLELDKNGQVDRLVAGRDLSNCPSLDENELRSAIDELNRSSAAIAKQTETLKQQQEALGRLIKANTKGHLARVDLELKRAQKRDVDRRRTTAAVEELAQSLDFRVSDLEQQSKALSQGLHHIIDDLLQSDDRLLSSLQKLGRELETEDPEEEQIVAKLRESCMRLIKHTVETIRTKLDRLYLEALESGQLQHHDPVPPGDVTALQEELDSLYAEILPVAQMSVEQQYLEPALKSLADKNGQSLGRSGVAVDYISECLDYLLDHIGRLSTRIESLQAHQAASSVILTAAKTEIAIPVTPPTKKDRSVTNPSPMRRRKSSSHSSPVRTRSNTAGSAGVPRRRSSGAMLDEQPLEALLRTLALSLPPSSESHMDQVQFAALASTLSDRTGKATDVARNAQETFEQSATTQLADARRAVQLLRDTVLADSPFGRVELVDPEIEGSITVLVQEVDKLKDRMETLDMSRLKRKSERQMKLVQRWGDAA